MDLSDFYSKLTECATASPPLFFPLLYGLDQQLGRRK